MSDLDPFFEPRSVAVVGASQRKNSVGYAILRNLLYGRINGAADRGAGFPGKIWPVNPKRRNILGCDVFEKLADIPEPVDLMVVAIPPKFIPGLMHEAGSKGIRNAIVISAGFAEIGEHGQALQEDMLSAARQHGIRLIGPNCLGVLRPASRLNASFAESSPPAGRIGLLSQSGALITGLISYAQRECFGLSVAVSLGGKADVEDEDVLRWLENDESTHAVALYVEEFTEPRAFIDAALDLSAKKPVVALKGGATDAGARAASSHTGSLAGSQAAYSAAFAQTGVLQAHSIGDFMAWSRALAHQPPAAGPRLAIITNAGGPGVLSADTASRIGLEIAPLSDRTLAGLNEVMPPVWSRNNPVDVIGDATPVRYRDALNILGRAAEIDIIIIIMTVQAMTDPLATAQAIAAAHDDDSWHKPLLCSFIGLIGTGVGTYLDERGIPEFNLPEAAVSGAGALVRRGAWLRRKSAPPYSMKLCGSPDHPRARRIIGDALAAGQRNLDLERARAVLESAGLRYNLCASAADPNGAVREAEKIGFPVVIKLISPDVIHKSDVGGVALNVANANGVRQACQDIYNRVEKAQPGARITGFTIEQQVSGTELIIGMSRDPGFGPLMMVGMGGIFVEVYKDVSFRLLPLKRADALSAIDEIQAQPLLDGARGQPALNRAELAEIMMRVSALVQSCPSIDELDINPLVITERGLIAIDARVIARAMVEG